MRRCRCLTAQELLPLTGILQGCQHRQPLFVVGIAVGGIHSVVSQGAKERTCPHARGEVAKEELVCSRRRIFGSDLRSER